MKTFDSILPPRTYPPFSSIELRIFLIRGSRERRFRSFYASIEG